MDPKRFVLATRNPDKVREIQDILTEETWELLSLLDFPQAGEVDEDGETFLDNALKKARASYQWTGIPSLADDSGLEVDYLGGAPGVLSSRFAGEGKDYQKNNAKLLQLLEDVVRENRTARFRCVVVLVDGEEEHWVEGVCDGVVLEELRGDSGFGYDPVFFVPEKQKTFAEMTAEEKNTISHRGIAFRKMARVIQELERIGA
jgi:XTP/dITP diphosphohydrolase